MAETNQNNLEFHGNLDVFQETIRAHNGLVVVKFGSTTCGPCKRLKQILPGIAKEAPEALFLSVEVDQIPEIKDFYNITSVPQVNFYKGLDTNNNPILIETIIGVKIPEIKSTVTKYVK